MKVNELIDQIKQTSDYSGNKPTYIGILPNDGGIINTFPQAILTFDETTFNVYLFDGLIRLKYAGENYRFSFNDLREIELGKYNFKERYIKLVFSDTRFIAFNYRLKVKDFDVQKENIEAFIDKLEQISTSSN